MPLSEHEQRLLEQMERALYAEDPKFASSMQNPRPTIGDKRRVALGALAFLIGVGGLLAGVAIRMPVIGVLGFLSMLFGIVWIIGAFRPGKATAETAGKPTAAKPAAPTTRARPKSKRGESLSERMEQRWRRRRESGDF